MKPCVGLSGSLGLMISLQATHIFYETKISKCVGCMLSNTIKREKPKEIIVAITLAAVRTNEWDKTKIDHHHH